MFLSIGKKLTRWEVFDNLRKRMTGFIFFPKPGHPDRYHRVRLPQIIENTLLLDTLEIVRMVPVSVASLNEWIPVSDFPISSRHQCSPQCHYWVSIMMSSLCPKKRKFFATLTRIFDNEWKVCPPRYVVKSLSDVLESCFLTFII